MANETSEETPVGDADAGSLIRAAGDELLRALAQPLAAGLYIVATPIGNLADITLRAISVLASADIVLCEDTRHSSRLFGRFGIATRTRPLHEHNEEREIARVLRDLEDGKAVALISDAGTPLISDPGFRIVRAAVAAGHRAIPVPGASAVISATSVSGLPSDAFFFAGFLPPRQAARRTRLAELARIPGSLVFYEAPHRVHESLLDMTDVLGARPAVVARELTKLHEDVRRGTLAELAQAFASEEVKGEIVILAGPPLAVEATDEEIAARLAALLGEMSIKDAARIVASELGVSRSRAYDIGVKQKGRKP